MPSFKTLSVFFTIAVSAFTAAAPVAAPFQTRDVVVSRDSNATSIPDILTNLNNALVPLAASLTSLTAENATEATVSDITDKIEGVLNVAITEVNSLASSPLDTVLSLVGDVLSVGALATTIGNVLNLILSAAGAVLKIVATGNVDAVKTLLASVVKLVGDLLSAIVGLPVLGSIVSTLLSLVTPIVSDVVPVVQDLGVTSLLSTLGV